MILIGEKQFGKGAKSVVDSLTEPVNGRTLDGFYKKLKRGIQFFKPDGELFAYLCANDPWSCFFVNAFTFEGRSWYQYGTGEHVEKQLGTYGMGFIQERELANSIWKAISSTETVHT